MFPELIFSRYEIMNKVYFITVDISDCNIDTRNLRKNHQIVAGSNSIFTVFGVGYKCEYTS